MKLAVDIGLTFLLIFLIVFLIYSIKEEINERQTNHNRNTRNWTSIPYYTDNHIKKGRKNENKK